MERTGVSLGCLGRAGHGGAAALPGSHAWNTGWISAQAGTYYVWIRSYALNASTNSVHLGNDGSWFNDVVSVSPYNSWQWEGPFTLNVSSTGVHTLGITRRESLTQVDKLFIGTSSNATPSGTGAPESARAGGGGGTSNTPPVAAITTPATGSSYSHGATVSFGATATDPRMATWRAR